MLFRRRRFRRTWRLGPTPRPPPREATTMSEPQYQQVQGSTLYQLQSTGPGGWSAYMLGPADINPNAPITIPDAFNSSNDSSNYRGSFLFAPVAPQFATTEAANAFVAAVTTWLQPSGTLSGRYCVWIPDATASTPVWGAPSFASALGGFYAVRFDPLGAGPTVSSNFNALIGGTAGSQLTLAVSQGVNLLLTGGSTAVTFRDFTGSGIVFTTSAGAPALSQPVAQLPLIGKYAGCLIVQGTI